MKKLTFKLALVALACTGFTANVQADGHTCADITFVPAVYERWADANARCLEIVTRDDGNTYARFEAEVLAQTPTGTYVRYTLREGGRTDRMKVNPPEGFEALIGGQAMSISSLPERQKVNVYLPERAWAAPAVAAAAAPPPPPPPPPEPEPEPEPEMPTTAGNLGWLAIFGALFLILGGALRFSRQQ